MVVIQSHVKLSYKNDFMIVRGDEVKMIHLSEINTVIIDSTQVSFEVGTNRGKALKMSLELPQAWADPNITP